MGDGGPTLFKMSLASGIIIPPSPATQKNTVYMKGPPRMHGMILPLLLICMITMGNKGCGEKEQINRPSYSPKLYQGDSGNAGITRKQSNEFIGAEEAVFNKFSCMRTTDAACVVKTYINNCKEFYEQKVDCDK